MSAPKLCPECGDVVPAYAPQGLCPKCLFGGIASATVSYRPAAKPGPEAVKPAAARATGRSEFLKTLREMRLFEDEHLERISAGADVDASQLARMLVRDGHLTEYQAGAVLQGKAHGLLIGPYLVLGKLGVGGMGVVFKAKHRPTGRVVALKMLPPSFGRDREAVSRFRREFAVASRLSHPNLVAAIEASEDRGVHFLTMEYIEGNDLNRVVRDGGPMTVEVALDCAIQIALGLEAAHAQGVVHRDIKPGNVMIDGKGRVRVLDLGLARVIEATNQLGQTADRTLTMTGAYMGTVDFLPPEQANDAKRADHRADIYSLGCTLYFLLTGRPPFTGDTLLARLFAHHHQPAPSLRVARPNVPESVDAIYLAMMAKRPEDRPRSAAEVARALEACRSSARDEADVSEELKAVVRTVVMRRDKAAKPDDIEATVSATPRPSVANGVETVPDISRLVMAGPDDVGLTPVVVASPTLSGEPPGPASVRSRGPFLATVASVMLLSLGVVAYVRFPRPDPDRAKPPFVVAERAPAPEPTPDVNRPLTVKLPPTPEPPTAVETPAPDPPTVAKADAPAPADDPAPWVSPGVGRLIVSDEFNNPSTGWPADSPTDAANPKAEHLHGYAGGHYRLEARRPGTWLWTNGLSVGDFTAELTCRVGGDRPQSRGDLFAQFYQDDQHGFQVRLTTQGELFLELVPTDPDKAKISRVGPIRPKGVRMGTKPTFCRIGIRQVAHRVELSVNGVRLVKAFLVNLERPSIVHLGIDAEVAGVRAEFDKLHIWADSIRRDSQGTTPTDASGRKLNLDFETGTLRDWIAEGPAFQGQPVEGDLVHTRREDMRSGHQGNFWVGTYERDGDAPQGTLTSAPFRVTEPFASFLLGAAGLPTTCVELVRKDNGQVIGRYRGVQPVEDLVPVSVDLTAHLGEEIFIRVVDNHVVDGQKRAPDWAHINVDDFRLHPKPPDW